MNHLNSTDLYEILTSYYEPLNSEEARLFSAGVILMLSNYIGSEDQLFSIFKEVQAILFAEKGE